MPAADPLSRVLAHRRIAAMIMLDDPAIEPVFRRLDHEAERLQPSPEAALNRARELLGKEPVE